MYPPPRLSDFEDFTVRDGEILTRFHAEPIFYRALLQHCKAAEALSSAPEAKFHFDEIYQERVQAVISAAACLEAFINGIGSEGVPKWELYEQLQPQAKWHLCLTIQGQEQKYDPSREPYQTFSKVIDLRNRWLHYKRPLKPVRRTTTTTITWIEAEMSQNFVATLPKRVKELIEEFCVAVGKSTPTWLDHREWRV